MKQFYIYCVRLMYMTVDAAAGYAAIFVGCTFRAKQIPFDVSVHSIFFDVENPFRLIFALWILIIIIAAHIHRLYHTDRQSSELFELWKIIQSNVIATVLMISFSYVVKVQHLPRTVVLISLVFMILFFSIWRVLKRFFVEYLVRHGYNNRNVLIIGAGKIGQALKEEIERHSGMGFKVKGFLDDYSADAEGSLKHLILGKTSDFRRIVTKHFIEHVFISAHQGDESFLLILMQARKLGVAVDVVPFGYGLITGEFTKSNIGFIPLLEYSSGGKGQHHIGKRFFDLIATFAGCIFLSPLFLILAILIKCDTKGSVFYYSERFGRAGKRFNMMKFRTMIVEADQMQQSLLDQSEVDGPIFKMRNDPRITRIGKFLRKYSLDELPQIFNVVKGDMSLVGPRPFPVDQIEADDLRQLRRQGVRPGITGLWQVKGRSDVSFDRLLRWDIWYIDNWSFWLDMSILLQTIPVVFKGKGAY